MKKTFLTIVSTFCLTTLVLGQVNNQGSIIVDPYYGFPNLGKSTLSQISEHITGLSTKGIGPVGLRAEYFVSDKIGVDFIYNSNRLKYEKSDTSTVYNSQTQGYDQVVTYKSIERLMQRFRFQARINYHFIDCSNENLDPYVGFAVGTNRKIKDYSIDGVRQSNESAFTIPFSLRVCTGLRYYFTPLIGANVELGLGGPLISAGVSIKLK